MNRAQHEVSDIRSHERSGTGSIFWSFDPRETRSICRAIFRGSPGLMEAAFHALRNARVRVLAVDLLVSMMHRDERGIPETPFHLQVESQWQEGKTALSSR